MTESLPARIMPVRQALYAARKIRVDVLRLDSLHPVISGNKWFKLKAYVQEAKQQNKKAILTFGGAWSNHIVATAASCVAHNLEAIGVIRGEAPRMLSPTLQQAQDFGMRLQFVSREEYKSKTIPEAAYGHLKKLDVYVIAEGGYGEGGAAGCMDILKRHDTGSYTHVVAAVGTGTMLAGLVRAALPHQRIIGISVLKNNLSVQQEIQTLIPSPAHPFEIDHQFHFGGYAKHTPQLLQFMNDWFRATGIPTDFVYTAKAFFAADQLIQTGYFDNGCSILLIHSGGLQGNRSLPAGTLAF